MCSHCVSQDIPPSLKHSVLGRVSLGRRHSSGGKHSLNCALCWPDTPLWTKGKALTPNPRFMFAQSANTAPTARRNREQSIRSSLFAERILHCHLSTWNRLIHKNTVWIISCPVQVTSLPVPGSAQGQAGRGLD